MAKYRVLVGRHREGGVTYYKDGPDGDVVESKKDLEAFDSTKFKKLDEGRPVSASTNDGLEKMSLEELRKFAAEEEIDLGRATKKEDVIAAIRQVI